jgi:hypothetical protein
MPLREACPPSIPLAEPQVQPELAYHLGYQIRRQLKHPRSAPVQQFLARVAAPFFDKDIGLAARAGTSKERTTNCSLKYLARKR